MDERLGTEQEWAAATEAYERFRRQATGHLKTRTLNAVARNLEREWVSGYHDPERGWVSGHAVWRPYTGDWRAKLCATPDEEFLFWRNFGERSLADLRRFAPYGGRLPVPHPWWLLSQGYQE